MAASGSAPAPSGSPVPRWRGLATLMYPAAVCPPPSPGRFAAPPATDRRLPPPSAPSAERRFRRRRGHGLEASIARSCRIASASTDLGTRRFGAARRLARGFRRRPRRTSRSVLSQRMSWCCRGRMPPRGRHTSTTRRRGSTTGRLRPRLHRSSPLRLPLRHLPGSSSSRPATLRPLPQPCTPRPRPLHPHRHRLCQSRWRHHHHHQAGSRPRSSPTTRPSRTTTAIRRRTTSGAGAAPA